MFYLVITDNDDAQRYRDLLKMSWLTIPTETSDLISGRYNSFKLGGGGRVYEGFLDLRF